MLIYQDTAERRFVAEIDKTYVGHIAYEVDGDGHLRAVSTQVDPAYAGQGIAGQLLDALVEFAQKSGVRVIPVCPYVVRAFEKNPEKYRAVM